MTRVCDVVIKAGDTWLGSDFDSDVVYESNEPFIQRKVSK